MKMSFVKVKTNYMIFRGSDFSEILDSVSTGLKMEIPYCHTLYTCEKEESVVDNFDSCCF